MLFEMINTVKSNQFNLSQVKSSEPTSHDSTSQAIFCNYKKKKSTDLHAYNKILVKYSMTQNNSLTSISATYFSNGMKYEQSVTEELTSFSGCTCLADQHMSWIYQGICNPLPSSQSVKFILIRYIP